ncbi:hypothetical protein GOV09_03615 [Candidatus Woesearchaeota archaeon]|nr:hypothetical protein [Candidatus Woesearchaeota archaeon]
MQVKDKLALLEKDKLFLGWRKDNHNSHLAHVFRMLDEANKNIWQFGYYNEDDTITTFILDNDEVKEIPEQKIFKKDKHKLPELEVSKIKVSLDDAVAKATELHGEKYKQHPIMKTIVILQTIEKKQLYNITFVTETFHTLNVRIDCVTGKVVKEKLASLMEMAKFEKGTGKSDYIG